MGKTKEWLMQEQEKFQLPVIINNTVLPAERIFTLNNLLILPQQIVSEKLSYAIEILKLLSQKAAHPCPSDFQFEILKMITQHEYALRASNDLIKLFTEQTSELNIQSTSHVDNDSRGTDAH